MEHTLKRSYRPDTAFKGELLGREWRVVLFSKQRGTLTHDERCHRRTYRYTLRL